MRNPTLDGIEVIFPDSLKTIKSRAFTGIKISGNLNLNNVTDIADYAFQDILVTSIDAPNLTTLGGGNFRNNPNLVSVSIPKVSDWSSSNFGSCANLNYIYSESSITFHSGNVIKKSNLIFVWNRQVSKASDIYLKYWKRMQNCILFM